MKLEFPHRIAYANRRSTAFMATLSLLLIPTLYACHTNHTTSHTTTTSHVSSTSLTADEKENCKRESEGRDDSFQRVPSYLPAHDGDICITYRFMDDDKMSTLVARYEDSSKEPRWAINLTPQAADYGYKDSKADAQSAQQEAHDLLTSHTAGYATVSPNGEFVSLVLRPPENTSEHHPHSQETPFKPGDQRTTVVVLDAVSGKLVRTAEVSGLVLGQALTSDSLAVETADAYYPAGKGKGRISVFSLTDTTSSPTSFNTSLWLAGSGKSTLLLSSQPVHLHDSTTTSTVTQVDLHGKHLASFTNSSEILLGGWIRRCTYLPDEDRIRWEVVDTNSGTVYDETNEIASMHRVPTGPGLVMSEVVINDKGYRESGTPRFWLSAADDGHPHTENLEQFKNN